MAAGITLTFLAALLQGTVGFGFAMASVPLLSLVHPDLAPVPQLLVAWPLSLSMAWRERGELDLGGVGWVLGGRIPGAVLGVALLTSVSKAHLDLLLGGTIFVAVLLLASGGSIPQTRPGKFIAGVASGVMSYVSSIGGPPIALLYRNSAGPTLRSSLAAIFFVGIAITLGARLLAGHVSWVHLHVALWYLLPAGLGLLLSSRLTARVEGAPLRRAVLIVAGLSALLLIGRRLL